MVVRLTGATGDVLERDATKAVPFELDDGGVEDGFRVGSAPWHSPLRA